MHLYFVSNLYQELSMKTYLKNILNGLSWAILFSIVMSILQFKTNNYTFSKADFFLLLSLSIFIGAPIYSYLTIKAKDLKSREVNENKEKNIILKSISRARDGLLYGLFCFIAFFLLTIIDETDYPVNLKRMIPIFLLFILSGGILVAIIKTITDKLK